MPETITFVSADGVSFPLTAQPTRSWLHGLRGRFMPPVSMIEDEVPLQPGARLRSVKIRPREVAIPILWQETTPTLLRTALRTFAAALNPQRGDGVLNITAEDGSQRQLRCRYVGGMELDEDVGTEIFQRAVLVFRAVDPFWYALTDTTQQWALVTSATTFFTFFPLDINNSALTGAATVTVTGDVESWPVWTITGPGADPSIRNLTTGEELELSVILAAGESIIIDTTPGVKTVTKNDGTNLWPALQPGSSLWSLRAGANSIAVTLSDATAASLMALAYRNRYLAP